MLLWLFTLQFAPIHAQLSDLEKLQGKWEIVQLSLDATGSIADYLRVNAKGVVLIIRKDRCGMEGSDKGFPIRLHLIPSKSPKHIDLEDDNVRGFGIYKLDGDRLTVSIARGDRRPDSFDAMDGQWVVFLKKKR